MITDKHFDFMENTLSCYMDSEEAEMMTIEMQNYVDFIGYRELDDLIGLLERAESFYGENEYLDVIYRQNGTRTAIERVILGLAEEADMEVGYDD